LRPEYHPEGREAEQHQPPVVQATAPIQAQSPLAPTQFPAHDPTGAGDDDDVLLLLVSKGVTHRIAQTLVTTHPPEVIRAQVAWPPHPPAANGAAGALVEAIRDACPPPPAWVEAQEHAAAVVRYAEAEASHQAAEAARRREWEAKPPEERIAGRLQFWL